MAIPENSALMKKNFGSDTLDCFDRLLYFFGDLREEPVDEWIDHLTCLRFCGSLNAADVEQLRKEYLKERS